MALLTIVDAVRLTGVSRAQLYRYLKAGRISRTPERFLDGSVIKIVIKSM
jgi:predicted DNA-binding transcriptional regulator AlpA